MPSPQALSSDPGSALDDGDVKPGPCAVQRGGQTRGPAAGDEQVDHDSLAQRGVLDLDPRAQQSGVEHREDQGGEPRGVHQRQRDALDDDRDVVGMRDHPVGPAGDPRRTRNDDDAGVPLVPERGDAPPPQALCGEHHGQHRPAQCWDERTVGDQRFDQASHQQADVQHHHRRDSDRRRARSRPVPDSTPSCVWRQRVRRSARWRSRRSAAMYQIIVSASAAARARSRSPDPWP